MATIQQQIRVDAKREDVKATWSRFVRWANAGPGHLLCHEFACVDAVRSGLVSFQPAANGRTTVTFRLEEVPGGPAPQELKRRISHDLVVFKDYVERTGPHRTPTDAEKTALEHEAGRKGDPPRHVRLSSENDTTFWRHHFPT